MTTASLLPAAEASPAVARPRRPLLQRVAGYAVARGLTEALIAVRGILLAAILGPAAFGSWALLRITMRCAAVSGLGISRGLEFELLRPAREGRWRRPAGVALGFVLAVGSTLSAAALAASFAVRSEDLRLLLRAFAAATLSESLLGYALVCTRVRRSLRHYAALETGTAALHLAAAVGLAQVWGLAGAYAGLALAGLAGFAAASPWLTLRPHWHPATLRRLLRLGVPVAMTGVVGALLLTADRWIVAGWGGQTMLGYYALGASVASAAGVLAVVVRTVVFAQVYSDAHAGRGAMAVRRHLEDAVLPFARLLPPVLGALSLAAGPLITLALPGYVPAIPSARLFFLAGAAMGVVNLAALGAVAAGMQRRLPLYAGLALLLTLALAFPALGLGLGLEGIAAASLAGHLCFAGAVLRLDAGEAGHPAPARFAAAALAPLVWCAAAVAVTGRLLPAHDTASATFSLVVYVLLMLPLARRWRDDWRRLRG